MTESTELGTKIEPRANLASSAENKIVLQNGKLRMSKFEYGVWKLLQGSSMSLTVAKTDLAGEPTHLIIKVKGPAARVPSTTNSRLNMFPKKGIHNLLEDIIRNVGRGQSTYQFQLAQLACKARDLLKRTHVTATINPEHKMRLEALTRLWQSIPRQLGNPLRCDKDNRWLVTLHLHEDLNRVDSHNLTKPVCDWLQAIGVIENDKHVDCFPMRNKDYPSATQLSPDIFYVAMRRLEDVQQEVNNLIRAMLC